MPSADLWPLAQQGDPQALETVFKMQNPEPSWVIKVRLQDNCLQVLLEAESTPEKRRAVALVEGFLAHLKPLTLTAAQTVRIWGRRRGQRLADWREDIDLSTYLQPPPAISEPEPEDLPHEPESVSPPSEPASLGTGIDEPVPEPEAPATPLGTEIGRESSDQAQLSEPVPEAEAPATPLGTEIGRESSDPSLLMDIQSGQVGTVPQVTEEPHLSEPTELLPDPEALLKSLDDQLDAIVSGQEEPDLENGGLDLSDQPEPMGLGLESEDAASVGWGLTSPALGLEATTAADLADPTNLESLASGLEEAATIDLSVEPEPTQAPEPVEPGLEEVATTDLISDLLQTLETPESVAEVAATASENQELETTRDDRALEPEEIPAAPALEAEGEGEDQAPEINNQPLPDLTADPASLLVSGALLLAELMPQTPPEAATSPAVAEDLRADEEDLEQPILPVEAPAEDVICDREVEGMTRDREVESVASNHDTDLVSDPLLSQISDAQLSPLASPPLDTTDDGSVDDVATDEGVTNDQALEEQVLQPCSGLGTKTDEGKPAEAVSAGVASPESVVALPPAIVPPRSPQDQTTAAEKDEWLLRPEIVVVLLFTLFVIIWQTYEAILEEIGSSDSSLSSGALARRLNTTRRTINRLKKQADFPQWSQSRDPDGIAWVYGENGRFSPVLTPIPDSE